MNDDLIREIGENGLSNKKPSGEGGVVKDFYNLNLNSDGNYF